MRQRNKGTTLIELVVYIAILTIMSLIILRAVLQLTGVFAKSRIERRVSLAAETALERMVREIRLARVPCVASDYTFSACLPDTSGGALRLHTDKSYTDLTDIYKSFYLSGSSPNQIIFDPDVSTSADEQQLTPSTVTVESLVFKKLYNTSPDLTNAETSGVRIELQISSGLGATKVTHTYYASSVLRGGYEKQ
ncbi:MAG: prepilin-type N-terminal cleavage/methylation domain-containing protein [Patescibacteria group bacterium]